MTTLRVQRRLGHVAAGAERPYTQRRRYRETLDIAAGAEEPWTLAAGAERTCIPRHRCRETLDTAAGAEKHWTLRCRCRVVLDTSSQVQEDLRPVTTPKPWTLLQVQGILGHVAKRRALARLQVPGSLGHVHSSRGSPRRGSTCPPQPSWYSSVFPHRTVCKDTIYQDNIGEELVNTHF